MYIYYSINKLNIPSLFSLTNINKKSLRITIVVLLNYQNLCIPIQKSVYLKNHTQKRFIEVNDSAW